MQPVPIPLICTFTSQKPQPSVSYELLHACTSFLLNNIRSHTKPLRAQMRANVLRAFLHRPSPQQQIRPSAPPAPSPAHFASSSSSASSICLAFLVLLAALFSICCFSAFARRLFSGIDSIHGREPPAAPRPPRGAFATARGMDPAAVGSMPVVTYVGPSGSECCVVCLAELEGKARVKVIPRCGHVFHPECIDRWLMARGSCPVCRCASDLLTGSGVVGIRVSLDPDVSNCRSEEERTET